MLETNQIIEHILTCIYDEIGYLGLCVGLKAYDAKNLPSPIDVTHYTVGPEENNSSYFENELLEACEKSTLKIRINCYTPLRRTPYLSHGLTEVMLDYICDEFSPFVKSCTIGKTEYDSEIKAYKITSFMVLEVERCAAENSGNQSIILPSNQFCKTHLNDVNIHLSQWDRLYLDSPYAMGTYKGTGAGTDSMQYINIGFRPVAVFVFRNSYHPCEVNASNGNVTCNFGYCVGYTNLKGVGATDNGFRVASLTTGNVLSDLNAAGGEYTYIAFR